jgi:diketogulonate reductase-like aldo/keto reductase
VKPLEPIAFGTGMLRSRDVFREAFQAGFRTFDTAVYYANDRELIGALDDCGAGEQVRLIHKVQPYRVSEQFERLILPKLGGRPLDTLLLHHPALFVFDARTEALMRPWSELEKLVERGLVRRIGCSNAGVSILDYLFAHASVKPSVNQIECHPWNYDARLVQHCRERGVEVQSYSPLGGGRLNVMESPAIQEIARATGRSGAQVSLRWSIQKGMVPIVRTRDPERMRENRRSTEFALDDAHMSAIDGIVERGRVWDDPIKRGCLSATVDRGAIHVPNRLRFAIRSGLNYLLVALLLRRRS